VGVSVGRLRCGGRLGKIRCIHVLFVTFRSWVDVFWIAGLSYYLIYLTVARLAYPTLAYPSVTLAPLGNPGSINTRQIFPVGLITEGNQS
jgi:hypothetical protein